MAGKLVVAVASLCATAFAQGSIPGWKLAGSNPRAFAIQVEDEAARHDGKNAAAITCIGGRCPGFGTMMQTFRAETYLSRRLRLSAWVRASKAGYANIWMRVDGVDATLTFDNINKRQARGAFGWRRQEIVLDVPDDAASISYGLMLAGGGQAWVSEFAFETVDAHVKSTNLMRQATGSPTP